ncbi:hypothetical protein F2Q69_00055109 [Brassica cretica]|uniref:Uncharacterized protein n=1 Tax=Brassica cretica TaxID=69181 RepID=A0A8S9MVP2_BRACR|nr:hypothetical protein F2Q69_00055109 [Brassica cretica]
MLKRHYIYRLKSNIHPTFDSLPADEVAQQSIEKSGPVPQSAKALSAEFVIAVSSADPSPARDEAPANRSESSSATPQPSPSVCPPVNPATSVVKDAPCRPSNLPTVDAKSPCLSSQSDIVLDAAPTVSSEVVVAGDKGVVDAGKQNAPGKKTRRGRPKDKQKWTAVDPPVTNKSPLLGSGISPVPPAVPVKPLESKSPIKPPDPQVVLTRTEIQLQSKLGTSLDTVRGESSGTTLLPQRELLRF